MGKQEHPFARAEHALSLWTTLLALGCDLGRVILYVDRGPFRLTRSSQLMWLAGQNRKATVECRYFEPASDFPTQPVGRYWPIVWQIVQIGLTLLIIWAELPGRAATSWLGQRWLGTGRKVGLWHTGALQMLLSVHLLSAPGVSAYGSSTSFSWWRYITGWMFLGIGFVNLILGMTLGGDVRELRHQVKSHKEHMLEGGSKQYKARRWWRDLEATFDSAMYPVDGDREKIDAIRKKMTEALKEL